mmetsp:Transcript_75806/g.195337  ORF Transcript_75806/g.195337 Transcript_75806/m.195337 type:complete len:467 (-) Transcript_75806:939-2339(-)
MRFLYTSACAADTLRILSAPNQPMSWLRSFLLCRLRLCRSPCGSSPSVSSSPLLSSWPSESWKLTVALGEIARAMLESEPLVMVRVIFLCVGRWFWKSVFSSTAFTISDIFVRARSGSSSSSSTSESDRPLLRIPPCWSCFAARFRCSRFSASTSFSLSWIVFFSSEHSSFSSIISHNFSSMGSSNSMVAVFTSGWSMSSFFTASMTSRMAVSAAPSSTEPPAARWSTARRMTSMCILAKEALFSISFRPSCTVARDWSTSPAVTSCEALTVFSGASCMALSNALAESTLMASCIGTSLAAASPSSSSSSSPDSSSTPSSESAASAPASSRSESSSAPEGSACSSATEEAARSRDSSVGSASLVLSAPSSCSCSCSSFSFSPAPSSFFFFFVALDVGAFFPTLSVCFRREAFGAAPSPFFAFAADLRDFPFCLRSSPPSSAAALRAKRWRCFGSAPWAPAWTVLLN